VDLGGLRANAALKATLGALADEARRIDDVSIRLWGGIRPSSWHDAVSSPEDHLCLPEVDDKALAQCLGDKGETA
jgi:ATP-dependent helicase Lhr and Lhr-like helicase